VGTIGASQVWAGIDVGKAHHWVCVVDKQGRVVLSRKVANDESELAAVVAEVTACGGGHVGGGHPRQTVGAAAGAADRLGSRRAVHRWPGGEHQEVSDSLCKWSFVTEGVHCGYDQGRGSGAGQG